MFETTAATTRIGLLVPSSNAVMEVEFYRSLPTDITVHTSHIYRASAAVDAQAMAETGRNAAQTALSLSQTQLALVVYGHTASSYVNGTAGDADNARLSGCEHPVLRREVRWGDPEIVTAPSGQRPRVLGR